METQLTDGEKQQLLTTLYLHKMYAPGLDRLAVRIAESVSDKDRESAMLTTTYYLAAFGSTEMADDIARRHLKGYARGSALAAIGSELAKTDRTKAREYLADAAQVLHNVIDPDEQTILMGRISEGYLEAGDWEQAQSFAGRIGHASEKVSSFCKVAESLLNAGQEKQASEVLELARANMPSAIEKGDRACSLVDIARVLARMRRTSEAVEYWEQAVELADHAPDPPKMLLSICRSMVSIGERGRAKSVAMHIRNSALRSEALSLSD